MSSISSSLVAEVDLSKLRAFHWLYASFLSILYTEKQASRPAQSKSGGHPPTTVIANRYLRMPLKPYNYRPMTPPDAAAGQLYDTQRQKSSYYQSNTSPDSVITNSTTPSRSPILRQHGPTLLPKIRTQDSSLDPSSAAGPKRGHKRVLSNASSTSSYPYSRPPMFRSATEPVECTTLISPISNAPLSRASSTVPSPRPTAAMLRHKSHSRAVSSSSVDEMTLSRFGYPTYRQVPMFVGQNQTESPMMFLPSMQPFQHQIPSTETPFINIEGTYDMPIDLSVISRPSSTSPPPTLGPVTTSSLLTYLTQPTQPVNLVRQLTFPTSRGLSTHFWWDVRNLRSWESFNLDTMFAVPDLLNLLSFQHDSNSFPSQPSSTTTASPSSEADLSQLITKIYFPKVNEACRLSLGSNAPALYAAPGQDRTGNSPHFLANYPNDGDRTISGLPRGRVVGIVKSFDRWNTGMRREGPARKVEYLRGLAHLQKCMRDHSCRYGFIITEIELVCVRAGCDEREQPYFGYLEVSECVATKTCVKAEDNVDSSPEPEEAQMTVSLALYYLLMLAKATPLPGQPGSFMDVGGPGAMTRQRVWHGSDVPEDEMGKDGKDKWVPEPQMGEKRDAKTARGWVWPNDPWHKREGGGAGRKRGN